MFKLFLVAGLAQATVTWFATCPVYDVVSTFDSDQYLGTWYEIARDKWIGFELMAVCTIAEYSSKGDGIIGVTNRAWQWFNFFSYRSVTGIAAVSKPGQLYVSFNPFKQSPEDVKGKPGNYNILKTDYTNFSVVYNCSSKWFGLAIDEAFWVLGRQQNLPASTL